MIESDINDVLFSAGFTHDRLVGLVGDTGISISEIDRVSRIVTYIILREADKEPRYSAFLKSHRDRCFDANGNELSRNTIETKAKRLEMSVLYKKVYMLLRTNLYMTYAVERMNVLDMALKKIHDPDVHDRDKVQYMRVFLESTQKPEDAKGLEVNVNMNANNVSINAIEDKITNLAKQLSGTSADEIIKKLEHK